MTDENVNDGEVILDPLNENTVIDGESPPEETPGESSPPVETKKEGAEVDPIQKRINKITAEKYEARREADSLKARIVELEGKKPEIPAEAPKLEDFDYDETKHNEALVQYQVKKHLADQATQASQQTIDDERQVIYSDFAKKEAEFGDANPEYFEAVKNLPLFKQDTVEAIYSMENGAEMAYYLATHLDIADKIASATPFNAAMQLGRIAATLSASPTKTVTTTAAPEPVSTLKGAGTVGGEIKSPLIKGATFT